MTKQKQNKTCNSQSKTLHNSLLRLQYRISQVKSQMFLAGEDLDTQREMLFIIMKIRVGMELIHTPTPPKLSPSHHIFP